MTAADVTRVAAPQGAATLRVRVIDRALERKLWGTPGYRSILDVLKVVEISATCPRCGGPRGEVRTERACEDGQWYDVSRWENPCGHLDLYADVLREAGRAAC